MNAAQALVTEKIKEAIVFRGNGDLESLSNILKISLWFVKPIAAKELKNIHVQIASDATSAWISFSFVKEDREVILCVSKSEFGMVVECKFLTEESREIKMFDVDDRPTFEQHRNFILHRLGMSA